MSLPKPYYQRGPVTLYHGDCLELLPHLPRVDAVVTDPPYPAEFLDVLKSAWPLCREVTDSDAFLFVMSGQFHLRSVMIGIEEAGWEYCWCGNFITPNSNTSIWPRGISTGWKPLLIYGKKTLCFDHWKYDTIYPNSANEADKKNHKWGQSEGQFVTLIERFDIFGTILDPFLGSGTTAAACIRTGRQCIGIELEEKYCEIAAKRCDRELDQKRLPFDTPKRTETQRALFAEVKA